MQCLVQSLDARAILEERRRAREGRSERAPEPKAALEAPEPMVPLILSSPPNTCPSYAVCLNRMLSNSGFIRIEDLHKIRPSHGHMGQSGLQCNFLALTNLRPLFSNTL